LIGVVVVIGHLRIIAPCITIADLPAHRERVHAAGADVSEISMRASRARSYTVDDPEGHRWYFSEPL
jgi:hypothetical protein